MGVKVPFDPDERSWRPLVLPGQIVAVTTVDARGEPNLAPKSRVTMAPRAGPVLAFGCNVTHTIHKNAVATGEFVVNVPPGELVGRVWALTREEVMRMTTDERQSGGCGCGDDCGCDCGDECDDGGCDCSCS
jgi:hypothetical protein